MGMYVYCWVLYSAVFLNWQGIWKGIRKAILGRFQRVNVRLLSDQIDRGKGSRRERRRMEEGTRTRATRQPWEHDRARGTIVT